MHKSSLALAVLAALTTSTANAEQGQASASELKAVAELPLHVVQATRSEVPVELTGRHISVI